MLRRDFLAALTASPLVSATSVAASVRAAQDYPPVDDRSVWLIGDSASPDPVKSTRRLLELVEAAPAPRDTYLNQGAVGRLETDFAAFLGKPACVFLPTGSMANQLAVRVLCGDRRRAIVQADSHLFRDEGDAAQILSGIHLEPVAAGVLPDVSHFAGALEAARTGPYPVRTGAMVIESPVRRLGGRMPSLETVRALSDYCRGEEVRLHLDGARLLLAQPELDLKAYAACFDTVYVSLYKYLDAPFGAVLAGSVEDIGRVRELRHVFGGALYQGWGPALLASAALQTFPERILNAHLAARSLFGRLEASGQVKLRPSPAASNIFELELSQELASAALARSRPEGVRLGMARDGIMPVFVNETLLRRPVDDYVRIILG